MKNLYIDFDGVILDTINVTFDLLKELGIDETNEKEVRHFYATLDWKKMLEETPQINNSMECIKKLEESELYDIAILTHVNSLNEIVEKVKFIRKHLGTITIIPVPKQLSKTKMVNAKDAILVDDYSGNLREWALAGGIGIRFNLRKNGKGFPVIDSLDQLLEEDFVK